jgi:Kdo2-lipid IVA lauroyltransferase/acyltransferase
MSTLFSRCGVLLMHLMAQLPLNWTRSVGRALGTVLYYLAGTRRRVVMKNLSLCYPAYNSVQIKRSTKEVFVNFGISFVDRSWLWSAPRQKVISRLRLTGDIASLQAAPQLVVFAPHFFGLDAAGTAIMANALRPLCSIYTPQSNRVVDRWIREGRSRFDSPVLLSRYDSPREIAKQVLSGRLLYLLPDMDFGSTGAEFVPFFGVTTATITSLSRFAKLTKARVISVVAHITTDGYEIHFSGPWADFPSHDLKVDTARMNRELQSLIEQAPNQYYWVHKRFKTRPPGEPAVY